MNLPNSTALAGTGVRSHEESAWRVLKVGGAVIRTAADSGPGIQTSEFSAARQSVPTIGYRGVRVTPAVLLPASKPSRAHFIAIARWEGTVLELFSTYFSAEVVRLDSDESAYVEFELGEVSDRDLPLCTSGALFYWSVGYEVKAQGQRSRSSLLVFRRLGVRTAVS